MNMAEMTTDSNHQAINEEDEDNKITLENFSQCNSHNCKNPQQFKCFDCVMFICKKCSNLSHEQCITDSLDEVMEQMQARSCQLVNKISATDINAVQLHSCLCEIAYNCLEKEIEDMTKELNMKKSIQTRMRKDLEKAKWIQRNSSKLVNEMKSLQSWDKSNNIQEATKMHNKLQSLADEHFQMDFSKSNTFIIETNKEAKNMTLTVINNSQYDNQGCHERCSAPEQFSLIKDSKDESYSSSSSVEEEASHNKRTMNTDVSHITKILAKASSVADSGQIEIEKLSVIKETYFLKNLYTIRVSPESFHSREMYFDVFSF